MKTLYDLNPLAHQLQQLYEIQQRFKPPYILTPQPAIADFAREHQRWLKLLAKQSEIINKMANSKVFDFPNIISNAVYTYHNTDAEVFEINVENQPVEISKTKVKEYLTLFSQSMPDDIALKLSVAIVILFSLATLIFVVPSLEIPLRALADWILQVLYFYYREIVTFFEPENFASFTFPFLLGFIIKILKKIKDNFEDK